MSAIKAIKQALKAIEEYEADIDELMSNEEIADDFANDLYESFINAIDDVVDRFNEKYNVDHDYEELRKTLTPELIREIKGE